MPIVDLSVKEEPTFENEDEVMVRIEKLGKYFHHHKIADRLELSFQQFIEKVDNDEWEIYIAERQVSIPGEYKRG